MRKTPSRQGLSRGRRVRAATRARRAASRGCRRPARPRRRASSARRRRTASASRRPPARRPARRRPRTRGSPRCAAPRSRAPARPGGSRSLMMADDAGRYRSARKPNAMSSGTNQCSDGAAPMATASAPPPNMLSRSVRRRPRRSVSTPPTRTEAMRTEPVRRHQQARRRGRHVEVAHEHEAQVRQDERAELVDERAPDEQPHRRRQAAQQRDGILEHARTLAPRRVARWSRDRRARRPHPLPTGARRVRLRVHAQLRTRTVRASRARSACPTSTPRSGSRPSTSSSRARSTRRSRLFHKHAELGQADVIALQEMREDGVDRIARALGFDYVYYPSLAAPEVRQLRQRGALALADRRGPQDRAAAPLALAEAAAQRDAWP